MGIHKLHELAKIQGTISIDVNLQSNSFDDQFLDMINMSDASPGQSEDLFDPHLDCGQGFEERLAFQIC